MPLTSQINHLYKEPSVTQEAGIVSKRVIYTAVVASLAAAFLGGESFSDSSLLGGIMVPDPIIAGLGVGIGAGVGVVLEDFVVDRIFKNSPDSIRGLERVAVEGGLAVAGGLAGLNFISGISPSLNAAFLCGGSYVGGKFIHANLDASLLGMIW
jgi:hypothetical protein